MNVALFKAACALNISDAKDIAWYAESNSTLSIILV
jgi:hypothetical protein